MSDRCELGRLVPNSAICLGCDLGKFGHVEGDAKTECRSVPGRRGEQKCKDCPEDTVGLLEGRTSSADCTVCPEYMTTNGTIKHQMRACVQ